MNVKDILVDIELLEQQYRFLINRYQAECDAYMNADTVMSVWDEDMWEGILNLFEFVLESENPLDIPRQIVIE